MNVTQDGDGLPVDWVVSHAIGRNLGRRPLLLLRKVECSLC